MTARSEQHEAEWFTSPQQVNQRRYEALRGYFVDRLSYAEAGARVGYTRWAVINPVPEHRAGKLGPFPRPPQPRPPPRPPPPHTPPRPRALPPVSWLLSLSGPNLTRPRRVPDVEALLADPAAALFAGLAVPPKKSALTSYSYRLSHAHQQNFLAALDRQMIGNGLATSGEAVFDLDFHAILHSGRDPALQKHYVPAPPRG